MKVINIINYIKDNIEIIKNNKVILYIGSCDNKNYIEKDILNCNVKDIYSKLEYSDDIEHYESFIVIEI